MKQVTIIERKPNGAVFIKLPDSFAVKIRIANNNVYLDFITQPSIRLYHTSFSIDYKGFRNFDDFSEKGKNLLLSRLSKEITSEISAFLNGRHDGVEYLNESYYSINGCLDLVPYMEYWAGCYNEISADGDILEEYTDPAKKSEGKQ